MEAKRLLREYRGIKEKLRLLEEERLRFESVAEGTSVTIDGQPHGSGVSDKMATFSTKAADVGREMQTLEQELNRQKWTILQYVIRLKDNKQIKVIEGLYLADQERGWLNLADDLGVSVRQVQRIHGEALEELERIIGKENR